MIEGEDDWRVLVLTIADKQGFTHVQAPRVEVNTLLPACLIYINGVEGYKGVPGEMAISLGFGVSNMSVLSTGVPPSLYMEARSQDPFRLGLQYLVCLYRPRLFLEHTLSFLGLGVHLVLHSGAPER